jgi:hypothetical protein
MTVTTIGSFSVGDVVPGASLAVSAGVQGINDALPDITARLAALAAFSPLPVDFAASKAMALDIGANLQAAMTLGLSPPDISAQITAVTELIGVLAAKVSAVNAQLEILTSLQTSLAAESIAAYAYDGTRGAMASELGAAVGGGSGHVNAVLLVATDSPSWAGLSAIVKVTP